MVSKPPLLLCLSGHDPSGGAGILADVRAAAAAGVHALTVITALTAQDSRNVRRVWALAPLLLEEQIDALLDDCRIGAIKIGLLGEAAQLPPILRAIERAGVPVVLDPVLRAGGGADLVGAPLVAALLETLLPRVSLLTPNAAEARRLAPGAADLDGCAAQLLRRGAAQVLVTGGDEPTPETVQNRWYAAEGAPRLFEWPRLPASFHGAGCTLASAIAARLARGESMATAVEDGQRWTQQALACAYGVGHGRPIPGTPGGGA